MGANAAEPILRVGEIALAAMHHAVPERAGGRLDVLTDRVRPVELVVHQPDARDRAAAMSRSTTRSVSERSFQVAPLSVERSWGVRAAVVEWPTTVAAYQRREHGTVVEDRRCASAARVKDVQAPSFYAKRTGGQRYCGRYRTEFVA